MWRVRVCQRRAAAIATVPIVLLLAATGCDKFLGGDEEAETDAAAEGGDAAPAEADGDECKKKSKKTKKKKKKKADDEGSTEVATVTGPRLAWQTDFTAPTTALSVARDGTLVALFEAEAKGYLDGTQVWAKEGAYTKPVRLQDGTLATSIGPVVTGFIPATGDKKFEVTIPAPEPTGKGRKGKDAEPPGVVSMAPFGSQLFVAVANAKFFVIDPPTCEQEGPACLRPAGALEGEYLEKTARVSVVDDGTRLLVEDESMRAFDIALEEVFSLEASANIDGAIPIAGGRLALSFGGETALLNMAACAEGSVRLARGTSAPKGCVQWRYGQGLDRVPPGVVDADTLAVSGNQRLQAVINGTDSWKSPIGAIGPVVGEPDLVFTVAMAKTEADIRLSVKAVDSKLGTVAWSVPLPFTLAADAQVDPTLVKIDKAGDYIAAAYAEHTAVLAISE